MTRLYETLAQGRDLRLLALALLAAWIGCYAAQHVLARRTAADEAPPAGLRLVALAWPAAAILGAATWLAYVLLVLCLFPGLDPAGNWAADLQAFALVGGGALLAIVTAAKARAGYRHLLLAGAVLAAAIACSVFLSLSSLTRPYKLAFEIMPVTGTVLLTAVLAGLGLAQILRPVGIGPRLRGALCLAAAQVFPILAGLTSILSFSDWMAEADKPASLATEPIVVVVAACGLVVLLLSVAGAVVDHHLALQAERESERLRQLADGAMEGILIHRAGRVLDANAAFCALAGLPIEGVRGRAVAELFALPPGQAAPWAAPLAPLAADGPGRQEIELRVDDGAAVPVEVLSRGVTYGGEPAQVLAVRDIRERREAEERIRHLAHHDGLTGLANRTLFGERFRHALVLSDRAAEPSAVLCLDLDRFKAVNDTLGHAAGDMLLRQVADRLREATRETDTVARLGGDEFAIVQSNVPQPQGASALAARLVEALSAPFDLGGQQANIGTSVGVALYPQDGATADALLKNADVALYRAKAQGRGTSCFYEADMDATLRARRLLERDLRAAVGTDQLEMHYQPLVACGGGDVTGFEALMRWTHPERGPVPPAEFIPLAEETGLILALGQWALETACRAAASWPGERRVAVNLSPAQLRGHALPGAVADILARTGLAAGRLELEVTESLLIGDPVQALVILREVKALGVRIALDDFGTGYSSLSYLRHFPFDKLKIDRSFVQALGEDRGAQAIVEAILAMSRSLNLDVTAEGVETADQLAMLRAQACGTVQGYLLGRPMQADVVSSFLRHGRTPAHPIAA